MAFVKSLSKKFTLALILLFLAAGAQNAAAQEAADESAQRLRTILENLLTYQKSAVALNGGTMKVEGDITVESANGYYAATFPHVSIMYPDEIRVEVGMIAMNAAPTSYPDLWKMSVAVPTPIVGFDSENNQVFTMEIGGQRMSGYWHEKLENFVKLDAEYKDMRIRDNANAVDVLIPSTAVKYNLDPDENNRWSGPVTMEIDNMVTLVGPEGSLGAVKVGKIKMDSQVMDMSPDALNEYRQQMTAVAENMAAMTPDQYSAQHAMAMFNMITQFFSNAWNGFTMQFTMNDVLIENPPTSDIPSKGSMTIASSGFGFDMTGFQENSVSMNLRFNFDDLSISPVPEEFNELTPTTLNFNVSVNNLPYKELVEMGKGPVEAAVTNPDAAQMAGIQFMSILPQLLASAGSNIKFTDMRMENGIYKGKVDAIVKADTRSPYGGTLKGKAAITGMERLLGVLNARIQGSTPEQAQQFLGMAQTLTILQSLGQQAQDSEGNIVRIYDFEMSETGQMMLNGTDMSALMGMMNGAAGQQPAPQQAAPPQ